MIGMNTPRSKNKAKQNKYKVMFIVADVVQQERSTFAEQIAPQRKNDCPGESAKKINPKKSAGSEIGYAKNYRQNYSESIGKTRNKRHKIPVFFDHLESFTKFAGNGVKAFEQTPSFGAAKVEIELIAEKRPRPGGTDNTQNIKIPLKGQKTGQEQDCFTLQKSTDEQHPVSVKFQVFFEDLLNVHESASDMKRVKLQVDRRSLISSDRSFRQYGHESRPRLHQPLLEREKMSISLHSATARDHPVP